MGRRLGLDAKRQREFCELLKMGVPRHVAARKIHTSVATIERTAGRDAGFRRELEQAEVELEVTQLRNLHVAAKDPKYWRAAAWSLERRHPGRYGVRRAQGLTAQQLGMMLQRFTEVILDEVPEVERRQRLLGRMHEMAVSLRSVSQVALLES
jgi:hypothetical protein